MINLLKYTYLLDIKGIRENIDLLWLRYQKILGSKAPSWEKLNEARAILYFLGYLYPEKIALDSLSSRIKRIRPKIGIDRFLEAVDGKEIKVLRKYKGNREFKKLKEFYLAVKDIKNRAENNSYLDERRFNEAYSKSKPKDYF